MANRYRKGLSAIDGGICKIYLQAAIGATGAPTLSATNSVGIRSIARNGAGDYTITFGDSGTSVTDTYNALRCADFHLVDTTARDYTLQVHTFTGSSGTIRVLFNSAAVTTELPNGATLQMSFELKNSGVI